MNNKHRIHKKIYADCIRATTLPIFLYGAQSCLEGILTVLTAGILGQFADAVFNLDFAFGLANLWKLLACIGVTVLLLPVISFISNYYMIKHSILHDRMVLGRFLDKDYASVLQCDPGDLQHRLEWEPTDLRCNFVNIITDSAQVIVTLAYLLYSALAVSPLYTVIVFAVSILKLTVPAAVRKLEQKYDMQTREYQSAVRSSEEEILRQPHTVKQYGLSAALIDRLDRAYHDYFHTVRSKSIRTSRVTAGISAFLETFCTFAVLLTGAILTAQNAITPGTVAAMTGYFGVFGTVISTAGGILRMFPKMQNNADRMELFYEHEEDLAGDTPADIRTLRAENLSFTYENADRPAFENRSFTIPLTGKTAVCGPNGCGKSTLIKILAGLLRPYTGRLTADGTEFSAISPAKWRETIAYAPQEPYLFAGTVRENVLLGNRTASEESVTELLAALDILPLADRTITAKADTTELSGGEKQKISIARALMKNAPVLILDEPGNNLDAAAQIWLTEFIKKTDRCVIYITHDPKTEAIADTVVKIA